ncbi:SPOR domain-containing protein [Candidatus Megaera polyxenophila]|nr:SPOR domain-containing protein [Candidatus Megaera polyxenophila]
MNYSRYIFIGIAIKCALLLSYYLYTRHFVHANGKDIIIGEEQEEFKRRPIDPGGIIIPHSNSLIYEKLKPANALEAEINLSPDPEEPIDLGFRSHANDVAEYDSIDDILAKIDLDGEDKSAANVSSAAVDDTLNAVPTSIIEDGGNADNSTDENKGEAESNIPQLKITRLSGENNKLYKLNKDPADSGYKIQLSSAWSEKEAKNEWQRIQMRHMKYLKNAHLIIQKVETNNNRIIYLVMAGNYPSLSQAKLVCKKLVSSKQNCIVTK